MRELLYGRQPVRETLRAGRRQVFKVYLIGGTKATGIVDEILGLAGQGGVPVHRVAQLDGITDSGEVNHQGLAAQVSAFPYLDLYGLLAAGKEKTESPLYLLLDHVLDPQNLGSLLRTAEAAAVHGVILPERRAAAVTPAAVRASAGAAEHVHVAQITNMVQAMKTLKDAGVWLAGLEASPEVPLYTDRNLTGPLGVVVGSEGRGLGRLVRETCDFLIRLPMYGQVQSLNAGVAGAITLYEVRRQRSARGTT
jgi:23S rRNA (guanosine2251-2'-O)-methyltransferase